MVDSSELTSLDLGNGGGSALAWKCEPPRDLPCRKGGAEEGGRGHHTTEEQLLL